MIGTEFQDFNTEKPPISIDTVKKWHFNKMPYHIVWVDKDGDVVYGNNKFYELLGYNHKQTNDLTVFDISPKLNQEKWEDQYKMIRQNDFLNYKSIYKTYEGNYHDVEVLSQFFPYKGNDLVCSIVREISESSYYKNLLNHAQRILKEGSWKYNLDDKSIIVTHQAYELLNTNSKLDFLPKNIIHLFEDSDHLFELIEEAINHCKSYDQVFRLKSNEKLIRCKADVITDHFGVSKIIGTYQDVTDDAFVSKGMSLLNEINDGSSKIQLKKEEEHLQQEIQNLSKSESIVCKSVAFKNVLKQALQVATTNTTTLITGETGTGKELLANIIHKYSARKNQPFIKINCATLPKDLFESELFGHKKGAFTGALYDKQGKFCLANGGSIFLDEIGEIPYHLQAKLLRVLQQGEFDMLGATKTTKVDVRIVAATNRDLKAMVKNNSFREDLFYRLNVFPIHCISLRKRKEDIPVLAQLFLDRYNKKAGKTFKQLSKKTIAGLMEYNFPGNIRELENLIERAVVIEHGKTLFPGNWLPKITTISNPKHYKTLDDIQRDHIIKVLNFTNWRVSGKNGAARILNVNNKTLFAKMSKLGIEKQVKLKQ